MKDFKILKANFYSDLEENVKCHLRGGYKPVGGVSVCQVPDGTDEKEHGYFYQYLQAMIKD